MEGGNARLAHLFSPVLGFQGHRVSLNLPTRAAGLDWKRQWIRSWIMGLCVFVVNRDWRTKGMHSGGGGGGGGGAVYAVPSAACVYVYFVIAHS